MVALAAVLGLGGCAETPASLRTLEGTYVLRQVDGAPLPIARVTPGGDSLDVVYGTLRIREGGRYLQQIHYASRVGVSDPPDIGTLSRRGIVLRFHSEQRPDYEAQVAGRDTLRMHYHFDGGLSDRAAAPPVLLFVRGEP